jgi:hypothetical protein
LGARGTRRRAVARRAVHCVVCGAVPRPEDWEFLLSRVHVRTHGRLTR